MVRELLSSGCLEVALGRCLRLRHRKANCRLCLQTCPYGAIRFDEGPRIDLSLCSACGICASVCPNGVFGLRDLSQESILTSIRQKGDVDDVEFICSSLPPERDGSRVPCLGYLDDATLVGIVASDGRAVRLIAGQCKSCRHVQGIGVASKTVKSANKILAVFGLSKKISIATEQSGDCCTARQDRGYSRREFFSYLGTTARTRLTADKANNDFQRETKGFTFTYGLPKRRSILLEQIKKLGPPVIDQVDADDLPFAEVQIGKDCNGCNMCVTFCPTGALRSVSTEDNQVIDFSLRDCLACGLCSEVCPQETVSYTTGIDTDFLADNSRRILVEHRMAVCASCGQTYVAVSGSDLCLNCRKRKEIVGRLVRVWQQSQT
ncbi:MAG: 4Fe-4S dicluster domain-containing protein [Chloroflexi bacterium]|nr:4Fe-4S dicluster domain-containing protein [Chloroflexota bacterium]